MVCFAEAKIPGGVYLADEVVGEVAVIDSEGEAEPGT